MIITRLFSMQSYIKTLSRYLTYKHEVNPALSLTMYHRPCIIDHVSLTMYHWPCIIDHVSLTMYHWPCIIDHVSLTMYHWPCIIDHVSLTMYHWPCIIDQAATEEASSQDKPKAWQKPAHGKGKKKAKAKKPKQAFNWKKNVQTVGVKEGEGATEKPQEEEVRLAVWREHVNQVCRCYKKKVVL